MITAAVLVLFLTVCTTDASVAAEGAGPCNTAPSPDEKAGIIYENAGMKLLVPPAFS